jgi:ubiquinone/menaquinone biosynthesis C-methylase UbiE
MKEVFQNTAIDDFEELYFRLRQKEGRIYSDEEVAGLPDIASKHPYHSEWMIRKQSADRLVNYLTQKNRLLNILEVGCGNGWLSAMMADIPGSDITGIDVNGYELEQAKRVFGIKETLRFYLCHLHDEILYNKHFDIIVFAASIQYFSSLDGILKDALHHLNRKGEIHIMDSPFYKQKELTQAKQRSLEYFESVGFQQMNEHYFHQSLEDLKHFSSRFIYNPHSVTRYFVKNKNPFPHICIKLG